MLEVIGVVFNVFDGTLIILDVETGEFVVLDIFDDDVCVLGGDDVVLDVKCVKVV